jgi:CelD/BcsL family acetyltransferase involved in cellulose biosynthesis
VFYPTGNSSTELLVGPAVLNLLEDSRFIDGWNHLFNTCPWATVFQSPSFVTTWYRIYGTAFLPVLIKTEYAGKLTGLLTLAKDKNGLITGAGANQAEYQVWLGEDANDETFIKSALLAVRRFFPRNKIQLKYIPAGVSLDFTKKDSTWSKRCFVKASRQPLMIINDVHLTNELRKKNRREKINRLKRLGALTFERISDYAAFVSVFDELALQSDFRKGAMYNKVVFKTDPLRKKFLLALFEQNNLHATVLKLNDTIIASNVSIGGNSRFHLQGINSFAVPYARYSPGIIHFLLLGKLLAEEGVAVFDLTPGADAYKDTLATEYTEAYTLSIGNNYYRFTNRLRSRLNRYVKNKAALVGIKRDTLKKVQRSIELNKVKFMHLARKDLTSLFAFFLSKLKRRRKTMKCWVVQNAFTTAGVIIIHKDNLNDLLDFDQQEITYSQQEFLADAMHRFEEGSHCYSWAEDGLLLGCAWLTGLPSSMAEYSYGHKIEGFIFSLSGLYCHPKARKRYSLFLQSIANELAVDNPHGKFYLITDSHEDPAFEKAGFRQMK